ncbi:MAG: MmcB family DNA repair protein [Alphaproteobacteria bacterium]|nr:MmcB family DNA repair protein [Alphaproteobacteria bacterium]
MTTVVPQDDAPIDAARICRGIMRTLDRQGWRSLTEISLANGRRADVMAIDESGRFLIVEVKSSPADYLSDRKWTEYLDYCDLFAFAVGPSFPVALLPETVGLFVTDGYDSHPLRPPVAAPAPLAPARRRQLLIRFARLGADRVRRGLLDPDDGLDGLA